MRVPLSGGPAQRVLSSIGNNFDCPRRPGAQCVASEVNAQGEVLFSAFDPRSGASHPLFRMHLADKRNILNWTISPDGSRLAMTGADAQGGVEILSLTGQIETRIQVQGWPYPLSVDWAADGKRLFVSHTGLAASPAGPIGATLLDVDLAGHAQVLWETRGGRYTWSIASPDGKYLAIRAPATERNAWMIENF